MWLAIFALVLALASIILVLSNRPDREVHIGKTDAIDRDEASDVAEDKVVAAVPEAELEVRETPREEELIAVVINPSKVDDVDEFKAMVHTKVAQASLGEVIWIETTVEDPGVSQAKEALDRGAGLVLAVGGDGTVRAVAEGLASSGVPLGIVPKGTGNLLARNLGIPVAPIGETIEVALTGSNTLVDVGFLSTKPLTDAERAMSEEEMPDVPEGEHAFAVVAGLGFDAAMVGDADSGLKDKFGWMAYGASAVKNMAGSKIEGKMSLGHAPEHAVEAHSIMFANCGKLPGGFVLTRDARIDDGWLDVGVLDTKAGIVGWGDFARRMTLKAVGIHNDGLPTTGDIEFHRAKTAHVSTNKPEWIQVDGDALGYATDISVRLVPGALIVRS